MSNYKYISMISYHKYIEINSISKIDKLKIVDLQGSERFNNRMINITLVGVLEDQFHETRLKTDRLILS